MTTTTNHDPSTTDIPCAECGGTGRGDELSRRGAELAGLPPDACIACAGTGLLVLDDDYFDRKVQQIEVQQLGVRAELFDIARYHLGPSATEDEVQTLVDNLERRAELLSEARYRLGPTATDSEVRAAAEDLLPYELPRNQRLIAAARGHLVPTATEEDVLTVADHLWRMRRTARKELGPDATEDEVQALVDDLLEWLPTVSKKLGPDARVEEAFALAGELQRRHQQLLNTAREQLGPTAPHEEVQALAENLLSRVLRFDRQLMTDARDDLGPDATEDEVRALAEELWELLNAARKDLGPDATEDEVQALADERYYGLILHAEASQTRLYVPKKQNAELRALLEETDELIERAKTREAKRPLRVQAARISGLTLSSLLPPGALRLSLMAGFTIGGFLGCVYWSWWAALACLAATGFSPWIVGQMAYLAGFVRGLDATHQDR